MLSGSNKDTDYPLAQKHIQNVTARKREAVMNIIADIDSKFFSFRQ